MSGCAAGDIATHEAAPRVATSISGIVHGGQSAISGSLVQLSAPGVAITDSSGGQGSGATAAANIANGSVTSITVFAAGSNYVNPIVTLTGGLALNGYGSGATTLIASTTSATLPGVTGLAAPTSPVLAAGQSGRQP